MTVVLGPTDTGLCCALAPTAVAANAELIDSTCVCVLVNRKAAEMTTVATHASSPLLMLLSGISKSVSLSRSDSRSNRQVATRWLSGSGRSFESTVPKALRGGGSVELIARVESRHFECKCVLEFRGVLSCGRERRRGAGDAVRACALRSPRSNDRDLAKSSPRPRRGKQLMSTRCQVSSFGVGFLTVTMSLARHSTPLPPCGAMHNSPAPEGPRFGERPPCWKLRPSPAAVFGSRRVDRRVHARCAERERTRRNSRPASVVVVCWRGVADGPLSNCAGRIDRELLPSTGGAPSRQLHRHPAQRYCADVVHRTLHRHGCRHRVQRHRADIACRRTVQTFGTDLRYRRASRAVGPESQAAHAVELVGEQRRPTRSLGHGVTGDVTTSGSTVSGVSVTVRATLTTDAEH